MVTVEEARQTLDAEKAKALAKEQELKSIQPTRPSRTTYYQINPKEYEQKVAQFEASTKYKTEGLTSLQERRQQLSTYEAEVKTAEAEQARLDAEKAKIDAELAEWARARVLAQTGKRIFGASKSLREKILQVKEGKLAGEADNVLARSKLIEEYGSLHRVREIVKASTALTLQGISPTAYVPEDVYSTLKREGTPETVAKLAGAYTFQTTTTPAVDDSQKTIQDLLLKSDRGIAYTGRPWDSEKWRYETYPAKETIRMYDKSQIIIPKINDTISLAPSFKDSPLGWIGYQMQQPEKFIQYKFVQLDEGLTKLGIPKDYRTFTFAVDKPQFSFIGTSPSPLRLELSKIYKMRKETPIYSTELSAGQVANIGTWFIPYVSQARQISYGTAFTGKFLGGAEYVVQTKGWKALPSETWRYTKENPLEVGAGLAIIGGGAWKGFKSFKAYKQTQALKTADTEFLAFAVRQGKKTDVVVVSKTTAGKQTYSSLSQQLLYTSKGGDSAFGFTKGYITSNVKGGLQLTSYRGFGNVKDLGKAIGYSDDIVYAGKSTSYLDDFITVKKQLGSGQGYISTSLTQTTGAYKFSTPTYDLTSQTFKTSYKILDYSDDWLRQNVAGQFTPIKKGTFPKSFKDAYLFRGGEAKLKVWKTGDVKYVTYPNIEGLVFVETISEPTKILKLGTYKNLVGTSSIQKAVTGQLATQQAQIKNLISSSKDTSLALKSAVSTAGASVTISKAITTQTPKTTQIQTPQFILKQRQIVSSLQLPKTEQQTRQAPRIAVMSLSDLATAQRTRQRLMPMQAQQSAQRLITEQRQAQRFPRAPPLRVRLPPPTRIPIVPITFLDMKELQKTREGEVYPRRTGVYSPSFKALIENIAGKKPKQKEFTGLEVRPIPKGFSWSKMRIPKMFKMFGSKK